MTSVPQLSLSTWPTCGALPAMLTTTGEPLSDSLWLITLAELAADSGMDEMASGPAMMTSPVLMSVRATPEAVAVTSTL